LGPIEYKILQFLMSHVERVHSRSKLLGHVWGDLVFIEERTVDVHIKRLRHALGPEVSHMIQTVRGVGYRLTTQVEQKVTMPLSAMDPTTTIFLAVNSSSSPATT
jgi:two-component system, OmpR family, phosphate regulon response regulator PhoB